MTTIVGSLVGFLLVVGLMLWFRHEVTKDWIRPLGKKVSSEYTVHVDPVLKALVVVPKPPLGEPATWMTVKAEHRHGLRRGESYSCPQSLDESIRALKRRPKMHPHSRHISEAGPCRHELMAKGRGRVWMGMRNYGYVEVEMFDINEAMKRIGATKLKHWWRTDPEYTRIVRALARYRMNKYSRDLQNAIITAWRA